MSEQAQTTGCAEESPKGETGEGESNRTERVKKEVVVATWNVRTLAVKGNNGLDHAERMVWTMRRPYYCERKSHGATSSVAGGETRWTGVI